MIWRARSAGAAAMEVEARVDETAIGHVDEEVEVGEEVSTNDGSGDVGHDEVPLVFTASEG